MTPTIRELPSLAPYAHEWDELVAAMAMPSPFLRSWWLTGVDDGKGAYVLVLDGQRLLGGLPLTKRTLPGITLYRFIGHGPLCPDHLDVVAAPDRIAIVTEALSSWARWPGNRLFDLAGVAEHSRIPSWLPGARTHELAGAPCQALPATVEEYVAARPRSFRKTVRRARNRFETIGAARHTVGVDDLDAALETFAALHRARGDRNHLLAELPRLRRALGNGIAAGEAWVEVYDTPERPLAVSIAYRVCRRISLYQTARLFDAVANNATTVLDLDEIYDAIEAGFTEVDLLRGEEPYKAQYASGVRRLFRVRGAHGPLARAVLAAILAARRARNAIRGLRASADESGS